MDVRPYIYFYVGLIFVCGLATSRYLLVALDDFEAELQSRIVNGESVPITSRPFQLFITTFQDSVAGENCGAILIAPNWALTAGHCVTDLSGAINATETHIKAGDSNIRDGEYAETLVLKKDVYVHPKFTGDEDGDDSIDLALLNMHIPFTMSDKIKPIALNYDLSNLQGKIATVSGWGYTEKEYYPNFLSQRTMEIEYDATLNGRALLITLQSTTGTTICLGDSGGPLTIQEEGATILVGVASYATAEDDVVNWCGPGANNGPENHVDESSNYVDIYNQIDWIKNTMVFYLVEPYTTCANSHVYQTTLDECKNVAKTWENWKYPSIKLISQEVEEQTPGNVNNPNGCYVEVTVDGNRVYFNHNPDGTPNTGTSRSLCKDWTTQAYINECYTKYGGIVHPTNPLKCCAKSCQFKCGSVDCDQGVGGPESCCGSAISDDLVCDVQGGVNAPCTLTQ